MVGNALTWQFIDSDGTFRLENPHLTSYLYFPLVNEAGLMSAITPTLNGDIKTSQNSFLTQPVSMEDLHNVRSARNFWVKLEGKDPWSVTGNSAAQNAQRYLVTSREEVALEAGFLWHCIQRKNMALGLQAEITNFVPIHDAQVELMKVEVRNVSSETVTFIPTAAIPIFGRSANNLRDHRHVTSLLHHIFCQEHGIFVQPTLSFDERGHLPNSLTYAVLGVDGDGKKPIGYFPFIEDFIGEGGNLDWPEAIVNDQIPVYGAGDSEKGYEALGGLRFNPVTLQPQARKSFVLILAILDDEDSVKTLIDSFGSSSAFESSLQCTQKNWKSRLDKFRLKSSDPDFDCWLRWVSIQPTLRRLYGNSFLPAHDYGRGGRGWRDLWQDILALLLMEEGNVSELLYSNFAGVRIDGSNATIIGSAPGEFKADRNNIPRVWMDHGAWPLLTTNLYIHQTGDLAFLLREQTYFKDHLIFRSQKVDQEWEPKHGTLLQTEAREIYQGTILEHLLIQHLTPFYNVGEHNNLLLEGADWNDGMDMAPDRGESVAFSALYAGNLRQLSQLVLALSDLGVDEVKLAAEILPLLDTLIVPIDYESVEEKHALLNDYYSSCSHILSGNKVQISVQDLARDLQTKSDWLVEHIRVKEWIHNRDGFGWFNGYYDNDSQRVEGDHPNGVRMTLTGQVFPLMGGIATDDQSLEIMRAADQYLLDPSVGGYRLNTDFGDVMPKLGRAFGFAYGHKENGAMFSHMAVMFAYALYQRGLVQAGYKVLKGIYQQSRNFPVSRMYPGIPEYFNAKGRGMYTYLTGSASWYLLTLVTQSFGVRGQLGDLVLEPKLVAEQFDEDGEVTVTTRFADRSLEVTYQNPNKLDFGQYHLVAVSIDGKPYRAFTQDGKVSIQRSTITDRDTNPVKVTVKLGRKDEVAFNDNSQIINGDS